MKMKLVSRLCIFLVLFLLSYVLFFHYSYWEVAGSAFRNDSGPQRVTTRGQRFIRLPDKEDPVSSKPKTEEIVVAVVVCGDRLKETLVMLKSAILFAPPAFLRIVIVTEPNLMTDFHEKLTEWKDLANNSFTFETLKVSFPKVGGEEWRKLFKPCASQRLFLPSVLSHLDSVLYVDTDVLFVAPLSTVWSHFGRMNSSQLAALSPEHEDPNTGWYNRFARHPYYGKLGVNSGVMLMNLTRMREFHWESYLVPILKEFKLKITWGDQDIINIIFHYHPERLYIYDCRHNYRADHCMYMSVCRAAEKHGARVVHGSRGTFHSRRQPAFTAMYAAMQQYQLGSDPYQYLLLPMESFLEETKETNCGRVGALFLKEARNVIKQTQEFR